MKRHWHQVVVAFCLIAAFTQQSVAQRRGGLSPVQIEQVDAALRAEMEKQNAVGLAVGVIRNGRIAYLQGYGFEDREEMIPVSAETLFRWASCSKPVTAVAAMQLVQMRRLGLDDDVRKYVPEFPKQDATITVRQLMCHQGGIVHYTNGKVVRTRAEYESRHPFEDVINALDRFKESPLVAKPGERYSYSTHGFMLLSAVVQRAGDEKFADQVASRIVKPCRMTTLQPDYQWINIPHRAVGYRLRGDEAVRSSDTDVSWKLGGGGFISNIEDFAKFAEALINGRLLSRQAYEVMWTPQSTADGKPTDAGLGFFVAQQNGSLKVSHNGSQEKTKTRMVIYPEQGHGVVVMCNSENVDPGAFTTAVYGALK